VEEAAGTPCNVFAFAGVVPCTVAVLSRKTKGIKDFNTCSHRALAEKALNMVSRLMQVCL
jgi:hypothetical protein